MAPMAEFVARLKSAVCDVVPSQTNFADALIFRDAATIDAAEQEKTGKARTSFSTSS